MPTRPLQHLAAFATIITLAACSSAVKLDDTAPVESRGNTGQTDSTTASHDGSSSRPITQVNIDAGKDALNDPNNPLSRRSIYFEYDSFSIKDEYRSAVEAHARYLMADKRRKVLVQGNTDERGGREYNIALGQKRAEAVRRALTSFGVSETQIEAVSFGEEKPKALGHDESAFAENRRADLVYQ